MAENKTIRKKDIKNNIEIIKNIRTPKIKMKDKNKLYCFNRDKIKLRNMNKSKEEKEFILKIINIIFKILSFIKERNIFENNIVLFYLIINLIISALSIENYLPQYISKYSYITLKIKGTGNQYIFENEDHGVQCSYEMAPLPDIIYINGIIQENIVNDYYLNESENNVKLIWENNIDKTTCMFINCIDITEVDLTNFDSSEVTNIHAMFFGCTSLISVNMPNFNVYNDILNTRMFYECRSLEYINIVNFEINDISNYDEMFKDTPEKLIVCTTSMKLNQAFKGCEFMNCKNINNIINNNNEVKCYKQCSYYENFINICQKCGLNYSKINKKDTNDIVNCINNGNGKTIFINFLKV